MSINLNLSEVEGRDVCLIHEPAEVAIVGSPEAVKKVVDLLQSISQPVPTPAPAPAHKTVTVLINRLIVHERPTVKSKHVGSIGLMGQVVILEERDGWGRCAQGWIDLAYTRTE